MRKVALLLLTAVVGLRAQSVIVRCGRLLDVNTGRYIPNAEVAVDGRVIRNVGPASGALGLVGADVPARTDRRS